MNKISRWGVGPVFAILSFIYGMASIAVSRVFFPLFSIDLIMYPFLAASGAVLITAGIPLFVVSVIVVTKAYNADELVTNSVFALCRHPLYASWIVFIVPGIALIIDSWLALTTPIIMYMLLCVLIRKEESYLEERFGAKYKIYKKKTPCILPYGLFLRRKS